MAYKFSRIPKKVPPVSTKYRLVKNEIPCIGTKEILDSLDKYESRSMHGQIPIIWDSAKDFNIFDRIYVMDRNNLENIKLLAETQEEKNKVCLILENEEVPDPYYGDENDFKKVYDKF